MTIYCSKCGKKIPDAQTRFCQQCGAPVTCLDHATDRAIHLSYAGFWRRVGAWFIDYLVGGVLFGMSMLVSMIVWEGLLEGSGLIPSDLIWDTFGPDDNMMNFFGTVGSGILCWLYYAFMESSRLQGTLGKLAFRIAVTDMQGTRVTFGRATGRFFAKFISALILGFGFLMVAFTDQKQGLHDIIADCLVVRRSSMR